MIPIRTFPTLSDWMFTTCLPEPITHNDHLRCHLLPVQQHSGESMSPPEQLKFYRK